MLLCEKVISKTEKKNYLYRPPKNTLTSPPMLKEEGLGKNFTLDLDGEFAQGLKGRRNSVQSLDSDKDLFFSIINESEHPLKNSRKVAENESEMMHSVLSNGDLDRAQIEEDDEAMNEDENRNIGSGQIDPNAKILERLESNNTKNIIKDFLKKKGNTLELLSPERKHVKIAEQEKIQFDREVDPSDYSSCGICRSEIAKTNCEIF